jgi:hypothetical protein
MNIIERVGCMINGKRLNQLRERIMQTNDDFSIPDEIPSFQEIRIRNIYFLLGIFIGAFLTYAIVTFPG